jgi:hypothetical protein
MNKLLEKTFFESIDWNRLRTQKLVLLNAIDMCLPGDSASENLIGILHLLDAMQDFAADELKIKNVFENE